MIIDADYADITKSSPLKAGNLGRHIFAYMGVHYHQVVVFSKDDSKLDEPHCAVDYSYAFKTISPLDRLRMLY